MSRIVKIQGATGVFRFKISPWARIIGFKAAPLVLVFESVVSGSGTYALPPLVSVSRYGLYEDGNPTPLVTFNLTVNADKTYATGIPVHTEQTGGYPYVPVWIDPIFDNTMQGAPTPNPLALQPGSVSIRAGFEADIDLPATLALVPVLDKQNRLIVLDWAGVFYAAETWDASTYAGCTRMDGSGYGLPTSGGLIVVTSVELYAVSIPGWPA